MEWSATQIGQRFHTMTDAIKVKKLVFGVGVNDLSRPVRTKLNGKEVKCPFYNRWTAMLQRCYCPKFHLERPTYVGCSVTEEWLLFSNFEGWMKTQDWEGKELDKDLLKAGNKLYSPDFCVFIPRELNAFTTDRGASRGEYPLGVHLHKGKGRFMAYCKNPFTKRQEHLGLFDTPDEAHLAWRKRKHELACIYADQQTDPRVAEALRTRYL